MRASRSQETARHSECPFATKVSDMGEGKVECGQWRILLATFEASPSVEPTVALRCVWQTMVVTQSVCGFPCHGLTKHGQSSQSSRALQAWTDSELASLSSSRCPISISAAQHVGPNLGLRSFKSSTASMGAKSCAHPMCTPQRHWAPSRGKSSGVSAAIVAEDEARRGESRGGEMHQRQLTSGKSPEQASQRRSCRSREWVTESRATA